MPEPKPELLPCPFCGPGQSIVAVYDDVESGYWRVGCGRCGSHCGTRPPSDKLGRDKVIALWNTRPVSELERLAREVVESRCEVESTKIYSSARVVANRKATNAFGALAAFLGPSQKGKQENG